MFQTTLDKARNRSILRFMKTKQNSETFPTAIKRLRSKSKLTQMAAAAKLGVPYKTWVNWEQGRYLPSALTQSAVLERL